MNLARLLSLILLVFLCACTAPATEEKPAPGINIVTVIGAIHGQHRRSDGYSLSILKAAIVRFNPDIIMIELPPERFATASANYEQFREVRETRADDFPELTDVVFPLRQELGFAIVPVAAWTQKIADDRRAALAQLEKDSARTKDLAAYQAAIAAYNKAVGGRSADPVFIHSAAYDSIVKARQEAYDKLFGNDLGPGSWQNINMAHFQKIGTALDEVKGQEKRVLILFGALHKYWFQEQLAARNDIQLRGAAELFAD
ncbi:MAG: hypothetical protein V7676_13605 [Parasphingorhabdus sp.]|uniref:hypothetical protein n=1 Tax=Parasphingorhabdus sp. TaxID=2709688 RepID=UPI00300156A2